MALQARKIPAERCLIVEGVQKRGPPAIAAGAGNERIWCELNKRNGITAIELMPIVNEDLKNDFRR